MKRIILLILLATAMIVAVACSRESSPGGDDIERARTAYSKGFYLEAEKDYERYLQVEPQGKFRKEAWNKLSKIAIAIKGDLDRAVVLLEAMYLELGTDDDVAWKIMYQLGDVFAELGNFPKALESFEKCLLHATNSPKHTYKTQLRMARLYRSMGNYDLVSGILENCANSDIDSESKANCLYELAQSYSFISNWNQSKKAIESLLALDKVSEETKALALFLLADIYENERNYIKTKEILESILTTYPNPKVVESRLSSLPYIPPSVIPATPPAGDK
jgi:tetratricopeptide (TPR) repeat protein